MDSGIFNMRMVFPEAVVLPIAAAILACEWLPRLIR